MFIALYIPSRPAHNSEHPLHRPLSPFPLRFPEHTGEGSERPPISGADPAWLNLQITKLSAGISEAGHADVSGSGGGIGLCPADTAGLGSGWFAGEIGLQGRNNNKGRKQISTPWV